MEEMERAIELAEDADSDYVTADRLVGDAKYYPNIVRNIHSFETPHHICLLKAYDCFKIIYSGSNRIDYSKAALVATDDLIHIIFGDENVNDDMLTSYESISSINIKNKPQRRRIEVNFGNKSAYWRLIEARSAPDNMVDRTTQFIEEKLQEKSVFRNNTS